MTPIKAAALVEQELDGERVVWHPVTGELHHLDAVATVVWALLDGVTPLAETVAELAAGYGADPAVVARDVHALVERLTGAGLLVG